jgi:hypothetical protein
MGMSMRLSIAEHHALLLRYLMVFLIGYVLFANNAGAEISVKKRTLPIPHRKSNRERRN